MRAYDVVAANILADVIMRAVKEDCRSSCKAWRYLYHIWNH